MKRLSFFVILLIVVAVAVFAAVVVDGDRADATVAYAIQTGQSCGTCHSSGSPSQSDLTATGTAFVAGDYVWPIVTTTTTIDVTTTTTIDATTTTTIDDTTTTTTGEGTTTTTGSTTTTAPTTTSTTLPTGVISVTG